MAETAVDNAKYRRLRANGVPHAQAVAMAAVTPTVDFSPPSSLATDLELSSALAVKAPLASPAFTGTPTKNGSPVQSQADVAGAFAPFSMAVSHAATPVALRALVGGSLFGTQAVVRGFTSDGDGGGGRFRWDSTDTTTADDGAMTITPTAGGGRWKRVVEGKLNARWFGMHPNIVSGDNTAALQAAVDYLSVSHDVSSTIAGGTLFIPQGYYRFKFLDGTSGLSTITVGANNINIEGEGRATVLTVRSTGAPVDYFFTHARTGVRGEGGGLRDLQIEGNSQLKWVCFLDTWRYWEMSNVGATSLHGGLLDACSNQTSFGENITVRHCDYNPGTGTNIPLTQYGVRFRAGSVGAWTECSIRDTLIVGCWDTGLVLDGCSRFNVDEFAASNNVTSTNTIDGAAHATCLHAVVVTNTITNASTADTGFHTISNIYHESHYGTETTTNNIAVLITLPAGQTGKQRLNRIENVGVSTNAPGAAMFRVENLTGTSGLTSSNTFEGNRRSMSLGLPGQIQVGADVTDTYLYLTPNAGQLPLVQDNGTRTFINNASSYAYADSRYPTSTLGVAKVDVGLITRDIATGRVCWQDRNNSPVLIGPRPGADVVSPYGAQRITALATPAAPVITVRGTSGSTTWTYYVVAIDKDGNKTPPSPVGTITTGPAALSSSNTNIVQWAPVDGAVTYDLLRGDTAHSVATALPTAYYADTGGSTSAYTASATNPSGILTVDGLVVMGVPQIIDPRSVQSISAFGAANRMVYARVTNTAVCANVGVHVGAASGNVAVAVYANNGSAGRAASPAAQLATSGSVACPAAGFASIALTGSVTIKHGDWLALWCDNVTATFGWSSTALGTSTLAQGFACTQDGVTSGLPANATPTAWTGKAPALIGL